MKEQRQKSTLVEFKEESVRLRNEMEAEGRPHIRRALRLRLREAKFWERLMEGLVFVLLLLIIAGCQTFKGATGDGAWMLQKLSDNVQTEK